MEQEVLNQLDKLNPLTLLILGIAYTVGRAVSGDLKQARKDYRKKSDELEARIESLTRDIEDLREEMRRYAKKKIDG